MSNRIKELRKRQNLTQGDLAKEVGVSLKTLQNWERGENEMTLKNALHLAEILNVEVKNLINEEPSSEWVVNDQEIQMEDSEISLEEQLEKIVKRNKELENLNKNLQEALIRAMDKL